MILQVDPKKFQYFIDELNYLLKTCWNIGFAFFILNEFMYHLQQIHLKAVLDVLWYLLQYPLIGLWYPKKKEITLWRFSNIDYVGNFDDWRFISAFIFFLDSSFISWCNKMQNITSHSFCKFEYGMLPKINHKSIWLSCLIYELKFGDSTSTTIWCNN